MHHIISDGWSIGVFGRNLRISIRVFQTGNSPHCPQLPIQFGDYAVWSREQLKKNEQRQTEYWKNQLQTSPALLELPTDR